MKTGFKAIKDGTHPGISGRKVADSIKERDKKALVAMQTRNEEIAHSGEKVKGIEEGAPHKPGYDEGCLICVHEFREFIESAYISRMESDLDEIIEDYQDFKGWKLRSHAIATGVQELRDDNTEAMERIIVDEGLKAIKEGKVVVKPDTVAKIARTKDEKANRLNKNRGKGTVNISVQLPDAKISGFLPGGGVPQIGPGEEVVDVKFEEE